MDNSFFLQILNKIPEQEYFKLYQFLKSDFHNRRPDVIALFEFWRLWREYTFDKQAAFRHVYPDRPYDADQMNLCQRYLLDVVEEYLAFTEWRSDGYQYRLSLLRALRKRDMHAHFERQTRRLARELDSDRQRHAGHYLLSYQLQNEVFEYRIVSHRNWQDNLPDIVLSLGHFFALENLRWTGLVAALRLRSGAELPEAPFSQAVLDWSGQPDRPTALQAQHYATHMMMHPDDTAAFEALTALLPQCVDLFPPSQCRDLYMTAINHCIRRQNKGDRSYTRRALELYRQALAQHILLENGAMPRYTYHNINALAHLAGESQWAMQFLESAKMLLPPADREATYRYNVAIAYFRQKEYSRTLDLLRDIDTNDVFTQVDIRRMLVRAYFELGEWLALDSLLSSFKAYLLRQKELGYHRDSYLNFIKYTRKVVNTRWQAPAKRKKLLAVMQGLAQLAEKEWLLEKVG